MMNPNRLRLFKFVIVITVFVIMSACSKQQSGYYLASSKVNSVIQINANTAAYSITSAPDVVSFSTAAINTATPNYRQYLISGTTTNSSILFSLAFHTESVGSGPYVLEGSQLNIGSKTYISLASKTTDNVSVTKLDVVNKIYSGTFSFYSFNKALATDSVLVTGAYSIQ